MGALVGFLLGYYLGAKAGTKGYEELRDALVTILESDECKTLLASVAGLLPALVAQGRTAAGDPSSAPSTDAHGAAPASSVPEDALPDALKSLASSPELQTLLASGATLLGGLIAQSLTTLAEPPARPTSQAL